MPNNGRVLGTQIGQLLGQGCLKTIAGYGVHCFVPTRAFSLSTPDATQTLDAGAVQFSHSSLPTVGWWLPGHVTDTCDGYDEGAGCLYSFCTPETNRPQARQSLVQSSALLSSDLETPVLWLPAAF